MDVWSKLHFSFFTLRPIVLIAFKSIFKFVLCSFTFFPVTIISSINTSTPFNLHIVLSIAFETHRPKTNPKGTRVNLNNPLTVFIVVRGCDSSSRINCWYASFKSILEKNRAPEIFAYKCSIFGNGYSVPTKTGFTVTLKLPQSLTVPSIFLIGTGVAHSLWSSGTNT